MIFADLTSLQQQPSGLVPDQNRKRAMQITAPMRFEFLRDPDFTILAIDENDIFLKHEANIPPMRPRAHGEGLAQQMKATARSIGELQYLLWPRHGP
jgi:hypothetical protein